MIEDLKDLFKSNPRSIGQWNPTTNKLHTIKDESLENHHWVNHLDGKMGVGLVPILDDHTCWWGAIDIDCHGEHEAEIDLIELEKRIKAKDLPLIVCRTKSGGAHCYLFGSEPLKPESLRQALTLWAAWIGYKGSEIFPKQNKLAGEGKDRARGNWLNMPYFNGKDTNRYAVEGGQKVGIQYFIELAHSMRVTNADLVKGIDGDHAEAPPCIQKMYNEGVENGYRNLALYNTVIYLKKAFPDKYVDQAYDFNATIFDKPLSHAEAKKVIGSAGRREYQYKCHEEPCKSRCQSRICVGREFGIDEEQKETLNLGELPKFTRLDKLLTEPIQWILYVDDRPLPAMVIMQLHSYKMVRESVSEVINRVPPNMKNDRWAVILDNLMQNCRVIEAPEDASTGGQLVSKLRDFLGRTNFDDDPSDTEPRQKIALGAPVYQMHDGEEVIFFTGNAFVDYLKKQRAEEQKGHRLWMTLRRAGVKHTKLRIGGSAKNVWYVVLSGEHKNTKLSPKEFDNGF